MRLVLGILFVAFAAVAIADQYTVNIDGTAYTVGVQGGLVYGNQNVYNVKAYGAAGDGVTDDTSAIQAAIDACSSGGGGNTGTVQVPMGTYLISEALRINVSAGIRFVGAATGGTYINAAAGLDTSMIDIGLIIKPNTLEVGHFTLNTVAGADLDAFIRIGDINASWIHDIQLRDSNDGDGGNGATVGILIDPELGGGVGASHCVIERIWDSGSGAVDSTMIKGTYLLSSTIRDIRVSKNADYGVWLGGYNYCQRNSIYSIRAENGAATATAMVVFDNSSAASGSISYNVVSDIIGAGLAGYGVQIITHASRPIFRNDFVINGNDFSSAAFSVVEGSSTVYANTYNGLGRQSGDPAATGGWNTRGFPGARVYDYTGGAFYTYPDTAWVAE